jgi:hypothetical protein
LIRKRKEHPGRSCHSQELTNFFNRYFAFHLVLARTAFRVTTSTPNTSRVLPGSILETSDIIDPYMGLSPALLLLIDQVAGLAWAREDNDKMSRKDVYQLKAKLDNLQQRQPTELLHSNTECGAIAEANRLGAVLLLYEICSTKSGSSKSNNSVIPSLNPEEKDVYIGKILGLILEKKANMMRTAVLPLWPLFLAGCCARGEEERVVVLQLFQEVESIRRFGVCLLYLLIPVSPWSLGTNTIHLLRTSPLLLKLSKWFGDSRISPLKMKGNAERAVINRSRVTAHKGLDCLGSTQWLCWVGGSSA